MEKLLSLSRATCYHLRLSFETEKPNEGYQPARPYASLSVGKSYKDFYIRSPETSLLGLKGYSHQPNLSMTPEEEAYEEALRPIRKAEETRGARVRSQPT